MRTLIRSAESVNLCLQLNLISTRSASSQLPLLTRPRSRQLPAGLINAGLASSASGSMFESVAQRVRQRKHHAICCVHASECHNLKASLKTIILCGTEQTSVDDEDDELLEAREV